MKFEKRSVFGWGASAAGYGPCKNGLVVHYDGSNQNLAGKSHASCRAYWRATRTFHMGPSRGWADIGYSYACCPHGYVMEGRGWQRQQAAQPGGNSTWTSVTFMSGPSEKPTAAQVTAFKELRAWLRGKGLAAAIRGHRDFISTSCPGSILYGMVRDGSLTGAAQEDDMPLTKDDVLKIWNTDGVVPAPASSSTAKDNPTWKASSHIADINERLRRVESLVAALASQAPDVDEDAVVAGVLAGLTPAKIAAAIPAELAEQVVTALGDRLNPT
jgi:hypothetical protein